MKGLYKYLLIIAFTALVGCNEITEEEQIFADADSNPALYYKGSVWVDFSPNDFQLGYNEGRNEFRLHDDDMSSFYILKLTKMPHQKDESIEGNLKCSKGGRVVERDKVKFKVTKKEQDTYWLWSRSEQIGIVIQRLY